MFQEIRGHDVNWTTRTPLRRSVRYMRSDP